ncbi:hypothetical protein Acsp03_18500 [Actinomadura sp. NBRC 104412]|nr:hypothetical protein Acsp03_18500 [Actinomadura sp. NBRC 104412]
MTTRGAAPAGSAAAGAAPDPGNARSQPDLSFFNFPDPCAWAGSGHPPLYSDGPPMRFKTARCERRAAIATLDEFRISAF